MLTAQQLQDLMKLQQRCEAADQIALKLNWDMLKNRKQEEQLDFTFYEQEELIGFLGVYRWDNQVEVCGMVHPDYRRRGVFTQLWQQAVTQVKQQPYEELLLNTPAASPSGQAFIASLAAAYHHSEYQMKWVDRSAASLPSEASEGSPSQEITLRPAVAEDLETMVQLDVDGFQQDENSARLMTEAVLSEDHQNPMIIEKDGAVVGKITITYDSSITWIYAFVMKAELRGQGIGRAALNQIIARERWKSKQLWIEVAAENPRALKLYESCGFVIQEQQDYYQYTG